MADGGRPKKAPSEADEPAPNPTPPKTVPTGTIKTDITATNTLGMNDLGELMETDESGQESQRLTSLKKKVQSNLDKKIKQVEKNK